MHIGISNPTIGICKRKKCVSRKSFKASKVFKMNVSDAKICIYFNLKFIIYLL